MFKPKGSKLSDIYSSTLSSTLQQGYPLWFPEPHGTGEVQIGDVGFIEDGGLVRLLNVDMGSPEHAVTEWQTAYTPSPLPARALHPDTRPNVFSPGTYKSRGIEESHVGGGLQGCVLLRRGFKDFCSSLTEEQRPRPAGSLYSLNAKKSGALSSA